MTNIIHQLGQNARQAYQEFRQVDLQKKRHALLAMADNIQQNMGGILQQNTIDCQSASHLNNAMMGRLMLNEQRILAMVKGLRDISQQADPLGRELSRTTRPNGLDIVQIAVPLGVIGVIYEARPNVTADAAGLCLWSGNAVILRGGSESFHSSNIIVRLIRESLMQCQINPNMVQYVPNNDRALVSDILQCHQYIDVVVPRGGKGLVSLVQERATMPVFAHLDGNCHIYVHADADQNMALKIIKNAKLRRVDICGACESLLIHAKIAHEFLPKLYNLLNENDCEIRGCDNSYQICPQITPASDDDFAQEYLDKIISCKIVQNEDEAIQHINHYGSHHTESIITKSLEIFKKCMYKIDSAIVIHNASTQFADGAEMGKGAEIGIATGRFHARGPIGAMELTIGQYIVYGTGQIRE